MAVGDAEAVVDEGRVELPAKIFAWLERQLGRESAAVNANPARLEALVQAPEKIGQPTAIQFRRDYVEARKSLEHAGKYQSGKSLFHLLRVDPPGYGSFLRAESQSTH